MTVLINGTVDFKPEDAIRVLPETAQLMADTRAQKAVDTMYGASTP